MIKIAIGSDEAGFTLKEILKQEIMYKGHVIKDLGVYDETPVLYPDVAVKVAESIVRGECDRGILICGTGIGMAITANKVPGMRAAVCHDPYSAERSRKSNDAQIMCLGARVIGEELAKTLVNIWLTWNFEGGGSTEKVQRIEYYDEQYKKLSNHPQ